jgi:hypothetical protein
MSLMTRVFGSKKPVAPAGDRIEHAVADVQTTPRPLRGSSYREASVTYESGYMRKGIVLDYSASGVRLRFPTNEIMPAFVTLNARAVNVSGQARVIWQEGSEVGLVLV